MAPIPAADPSPPALHRFTTAVRGAGLGLSSASLDAGRAGLPLWQQYLLALVAVTASLLLREALRPWLSVDLPLLPLFGVLLVLVLLVQPGPFLAAATLGGLGVAWRMGGAGGPADLALLAAAVGLTAGPAAWLSVRHRQRLRAAGRPAGQLPSDRGAGADSGSAPAGHPGGDPGDRPAAQAASARSEVLFRRIADANLIGVAFGDTRGGVSYINDEMLRMMGRTREDFESGRIDWVQAVAPEFAPLHDDWRARLLSDGQVARYERAFLRPDGGRTPYIGAAALLEPGSGDDTHVRVALDLTPLRRTEESNAQLVQQLRDADRRKDEFLATLAHELRNPLAPSAHALEILKRPGAEPPTPAAARALSTLERQMRHMVRLIDDLLDVSRITRDRLELRPQRVDLLAVLEHAVEAARPALAAARQPLDFQHPAGPLWLQADPVRLSQVFSNLLGNAGKYSPPGSPVRLKVGRHDGAYEVAVRDEGAGIAPQTLPRLFDMFTQGDVQPGQVQGGLGIGLALARRLTELHGGRLDAHSDGPGRGSEFVVRLPRGGEAGEGALHAASDVLPGVASSGPPGPSPWPLAEPPLAGPGAAAAGWRVLVVDDNVDAAHTLALLLEITGHVVAIAHDGLDALSQAERFRPDVVLLDIGLPRLDGHEVARRLRQQDWGRDVVLVALTGWGQAPDREASVAAGFDAHLVKPVEHEVLMARLQALMAGRSAGAAGSAGEQAPP